MSNREIAIEFVRRFCAGEVDALTSLLAEDLRLRGPLYRFDSRDAYLDSLRNDRPQKGEHRVLSVTESPDHVSVFYEYIRGERPFTIAQLFRFRDERIAEILLVFDASELGR